MKHGADKCRHAGRDGHRFGQLAALRRASVRLVAFFTAVIGATAAAWHAVAGLTKQATSRVNDPVYDRALSKQVARRVNAPLHRALSKALQRALRQSGGATGAAGKEEGAGL